MNVRRWLPLAAASLIGILAGAGFYRASGQDAAAPAVRAAGAQGNPRQDGWFGLSFGDLVPGMGSGTATSAARSAFETALRLPPGDARSAALQAAFSRWMVDAPAEASAHVASIPADDRRAVVTAALAALARASPASLKRYAALLGDGGADLVDVIAAIAERDPALALDWIGRHPQLDVKGVLTAAALPGLIERDVTLAARTVAGMKEDAPVALIQQVASAYARHDPARAYEWAAQVAGGRDDLTPARLMDDVSASLAARDQYAAEEFMERSGDPAIKTSLMSELAIRKGQDDLGQAWRWLGQHGGDPAYAEAAQNLLYRWSYTRPEEVARILPGVHDAGVQATATAHLTQFWMKKDPAAYEKWVASLPPGQLRVNALAAR